MNKETALSDLMASQEELKKTLDKYRSNFNDLVELSEKAKIYGGLEEDVKEARKNIERLESDFNRVNNSISKIQELYEQK